MLKSITALRSCTVIVSIFNSSDTELGPLQTTLSPAFNQATLNYSHYKLQRPEVEHENKNTKIPKKADLQGPSGKYNSLILVL